MTDYSGQIAELRHVAAILCGVSRDVELDKTTRFQCLQAACQVEDAAWFLEHPE